MNKFEIKCLECGGNDVQISVIDYQYGLAKQFMLSCNNHECNNTEELEED